MHNCFQMNVAPKGPEAARSAPAQVRPASPVPLCPKISLLPRYLSLTHRRCGKPTCHCASGEGHPIWFLTFMSAGKRRVERIPKEWVDDVRQRVEAGRRFQDALREVLTADAELLVLLRKQQGQ